MFNRCEGCRYSREEPPDVGVLRFQKEAEWGTAFILQAFSQLFELETPGTVEISSTYVFLRVLIFRLVVRRRFVDRQEPGRHLEKPDPVREALSP